MPNSPDSTWTDRVLIAGGHEHSRGGLEIFIERARACLGIEAHCYSETPGRGLRSVGRYLGQLWRFSRLLRDYDCVWLHYGSAFDLGYLAVAKLAGKRVAVTPHLGRAWRAMRIGILRGLSNRLLMTADIVFTLYKAQPLELDLPAALKRRCIVMGTFLPKALLESRVERRPETATLRLLHLARLSPAKGSFAFLAVCEELRRLDIDFQATIAGPADQDVRDALHAAISEKNLPVTMLGGLAPSVAMDLLRSHDVLVNLSLQDAYPLTVIEALLCGVTPVCSRLQGTEELAGQSTAICLIDGQNAKAAAEGILAIDRHAAPVGAAGMRQTFGWPDMQIRYRAAFTTLLSARGAAFRAQITRALPR